MTVPTLTYLTEVDSRRFEASGSWTARHSTALEILVRRQLENQLSTRKATIDLAGIDELDTFGAWFLETLSRAGGSTFSGVPYRFQNLLLEIRQTNRRARPAQSRQPWLLFPLSPRHSQLPSFGQKR